MDFYVCLRGSTWWNERCFDEALHYLSERLTPLAGADIKFKITSLRKLKKVPVTMFSHDLIMGHRWVHGSELLLAGCEHHCLGSQIPLTEATRLLMNRCSGLVFAKERLQRPEFTEEDADFVGRNLAKAQLGFGDVVLAVHRQYHWSCRKRDDELGRLTADEDLPWLDAVRRHHAAGLEFKLHPQRHTGPSGSLVEVHRELSMLGLQIWLWLESRRLDRPFRSAREYAEHPADKCGETQAWRNVLVNGKAFGPTAVLAEEGTRYPRERLLRVLPLLLWEPSMMDDPALLAQVQRELRTDAKNFPGLVAGYQQIWSRFN